MRKSSRILKDRNWKFEIKPLGNNAQLKTRKHKQ